MKKNKPKEKDLRFYAIFQLIDKKDTAHGTYPDKPNLILIKTDSSPSRLKHWFRDNYGRVWGNRQGNHVNWQIGQCSLLEG